MFKFKSIYEAYLECRRGKRATANALKFEQNLIENLCDLETSLQNRAYRPSRSICFLSNSPKLREIFAADFGDRVVHHLLVPHLQNIFEPKFIYDVYNNRVGKGIHGAVSRARQFAVASDVGCHGKVARKACRHSCEGRNPGGRSFVLGIFLDSCLRRNDDKQDVQQSGSNNGYTLQLNSPVRHCGLDPQSARLPDSSETIRLRVKPAMTEGMRNGSYYLQLDVKNFFYSIDKNILFKKLFDGVQKSTLYDEEAKRKILWLSNIIIYNDVTKNYLFKGDKKSLDTLPQHKSLFKLPKHLGLPIGNLTSQFFANLYMNDFDHFIKRELKCKRYIRYVDDFVIFDADKERLVQIKQKIEEYLQGKLKLKLRDECRLRDVNEGLDFLGYVIRPNYTLVRRRVVNNYKHKKAVFLDGYENSEGKMSLEEIKRFLSVQASFLGHIKHANSHKLKIKTGEIDDKKYIDAFLRS